tara:strand:+ start:1175 stop:1303 length:129 start_codon:yes stop_codon:yes gene_type:complete
MTPLFQDLTTGQTVLLYAKAFSIGASVTIVCVGLDHIAKKDK